MTEMKVAVCGTPMPKADIMTASLPNDCLAVADPELAAQWHPTKNGDLTPDKISKNSNKRVWWKDKYGHEWLAAVKSRSAGIGCPFCLSRKAVRNGDDHAAKKASGNTAIDPELAAEWHPTRNGDLTPDMVTAESHRKVWWLGKCGHEWSATIDSRTRGMGCPFCHKAG